MDNIYTQKECNAIYDSQNNHLDGIQKYLNSNLHNSKAEILMLNNSIKNCNFEMFELLINSGRFNTDLFLPESNFYEVLFMDCNQLFFIEKVFSLSFIRDNLNQSCVNLFMSWVNDDVKAFLTTLKLKSKITNF